MCGITEWRGIPLTVIMDHIDGNSNNSNLSNLRLICSNCDMLLLHINPKIKNPADIIDDNDIKRVKVIKASLLMESNHRLLFTKKLCCHYHQAGIYKLYFKIGRNDRIRTVILQLLLIFMYLN